MLKYFFKFRSLSNKYYHYNNVICLSQLVANEFKLKDFIPLFENIDIGEIFLSSNVQNIILNINKEILDVSKVFQPIKQKVELSTIKLMTNEELAPLIDDAKVRALHKLQSPPILAPRKPIKGILEENIQIKDFDTANYVFTDITFGINDRERFIVVREPNGILRKATWEERDHMNQIYFPKEKRELRVPKMFDEEYFQDALEKGRHIFVLNRIIVQFEPDHPDYLKHMFRVFDHLILHSKLETIRSTRYFGTCVLYCALRGNVDDILLYILKDMGKTPTSYDNLDTKLESISLKPSNAAIKASYLTVQLYDIAQEQLYSTFNKTKSDNNISTINSCPIENDQDLTLNTRLLENDDTEPLLFQILNYVKKRRDNKSLHKVIGKDDIKLRELTDIIKVLLNTEDDLENQRQL